MYNGALRLGGGGGHMIQKQIKGGLESNEMDRKRLQEQSGAFEVRAGYRG